MGRYYIGDIEGKFWVGTQSSSAADRFGVEGIKPEYLEYNFDESHLEMVEAEIVRIEEFLGDKKKTIDEFFEVRDGYNDEMLLEIGVTPEELSEYADLGLGIEIRDCIKELGYCSFEAEL
jgi:hypothetical protein